MQLLNPFKIYILSFHRGIPNYEFKVGRITFIRNSRPVPRKFVDDVRNVKGFITHLYIFHYAVFTVYCFFKIPFNPPRMMPWTDSSPSLEKDNHYAKRAESHEGFKVEGLHNAHGLTILIVTFDSRVKRKLTLRCTGILILSLFAVDLGLYIIKTWKQYFWAQKPNSLKCSLVCGIIYPHIPKRE